MVDYEWLECGNRIHEVLSLQQANLREHVTDPARGFLTWNCDVETLSKIVAVTPASLAVAHGIVVGYVVVALPAESQRHPLFVPLHEHLKDNKLIPQSRWLMDCQACVRQGYERRGILRELYARVSTRYRNEYAVLLGEINCLNEPSLRAHQNLGARWLGEYRSADASWRVFSLQL